MTTSDVSFATVIITIVAIGLLVIVGSAAACSARQKVRHECDVFGKTELTDSDASNTLTYRCEPAK